MSVDSSMIPAKINNFNAYLNGNKMIGVTGEVTLPTPKMKTITLDGAGLGGDIDDPTIGQWESMEQEMPLNLIHSSFASMLSPMEALNLTLRAAQQGIDNATGSYKFHALRVVEKGRVKQFNPGKIKKGESMECSVTLELTYLMIEDDGVKLLEIDKLNEVYIVNDVDLLAEIRAMV